MWDGQIVPTHLSIYLSDQIMQVSETRCCFSDDVLLENLLVVIRYYFRNHTCSYSTALHNTLYNIPNTVLDDISFQAQHTLALVSIQRDEHLACTMGKSFPCTYMYIYMYREREPPERERERERLRERHHGFMGRQKE